MTITMQRSAWIDTPDAAFAWNPPRGQRPEGDRQAAGGGGGGKTRRAADARPERFQKPGTPPGMFRAPPSPWATQYYGRRRVSIPSPSKRGWRMMCPVQAARKLFGRRNPDARADSPARPAGAAPARPATGSRPECATSNAPRDGAGIDACEPEFVADRARNFGDRRRASARTGAAARRRGTR